MFLLRIIVVITVGASWVLLGLLLDRNLGGKEETKIKGRPHKRGRFALKSVVIVTVLAVASSLFMDHLEGQETIEVIKRAVIESRDQVRQDTQEIIAIQRAGQAVQERLFREGTAKINRGLEELKALRGVMP